MFTLSNAANAVIGRKFGDTLDTEVSRFKFKISKLKIRGIYSICCVKIFFQ